ncbi:MAG TPA: tRNA (adenosine(37)-N6)-threonylcarbamoyltransferase complex ATPase subunit type 1 TsaE [Bacillota bacterium]|nr:MAG: tRNA threonylcarbamoyladenosine biosynthesis protein TsaE [Firmicutes bacterium ADurb.Bin153]HNV34784.1 tRNA (adenosine(37)-N6)-threonylcarbamoyltransferase complex ATPase subunit type 1 TsaE [Bacillota bacterium]HPU96318.1 tRNA (adenosine(37)-N6)-threonylcarbamoyltransferase complex ATPase subunit type 1 TsaE [Bacillota bacterium]
MPRFFFTTASEKETQALGEKLGAALQDGAVVLLDGEIGAGKTCFTRGLAKGLGLDPDDVASPTFTLVHEHRNGRRLYHMDLYRLSSAREAEEGGLMEYFAEDAVAVVEWPAPIAGMIGPGAVRVGIAVGVTDDERKITMDIPEGMAFGPEGI